MPQHKRRASDRQMMTRIWQSYAPYWHFCMAILAAIAFFIIWYSTVNQAMAQTTKNTSDISILQQELANIDGKIDIIVEAVRRK